jgi:hypothetical protein
MERVLYNTVLGAKRLEPDGRAFYYSDYHSPAHKVYFPDAWPCCSGTLPQVSADYRVSTYLHDSDNLFVNLYLPSTVQWLNRDGAQIVLTQAGDYPIGGRVSMVLRTARPSTFGLRLRIPAWASAPSPGVRVNNEPIAAPVQNGFATLRRLWKDGDRVELDFAMPLRLEAIDENHPNTVALVRGPLVLLAISDHPPALTRQQLLSAEKDTRQPVWRVKTGSSSLLLKPFLTTSTETYTTYVSVV